MPSRAIKEGSVGLLLLAGVGLLAGAILWVRGTDFRGKSYAMEVELPNALGLNVGSSVQFRGVKVGHVTSVQPTPNGVLIGFKIQPSSLLIPRKSTIQTSQSGFVGQITLNISPDDSGKKVPQNSALTPFSNNCDPSLILCDGDRILGQSGTNFDELIQATTRIAELLGDGELINTTNVTLKNLSLAAISFRELSRNASTTLVSLNDLSKDAKTELRNLGEIRQSVTQAADSVSSSATEVGKLGNRFSQTAGQIDLAAANVSSLIQENRGTLISTLRNLDSVSQELKVTLNSLEPVIGKVEKSNIVENLDQLTANGAELTQSLKGISKTANNPAILLGLVQTLDAARSTFQNTQKITTDLEQLTGNTEFRENLIRLINGLSKLVSSTQDLEQQYRLVKDSDSEQELAQQFRRVKGAEPEPQN